MRGRQTERLRRCDTELDIRNRRRGGKEKEGDRERENEKGYSETFRWNTR